MAVKRLWKIVSRVLLTLGLTVYVIVALANYSIVQSYAGAAVSSYFSKEWGGKLSIGSLHAMPFDHLILDNILWISPTNDTICQGESIRVSFKKFPFDGKGLDLNNVHLRNVYYHFQVNEDGINLKFLIDYFKSDKKKKKKEHEPFYVKAKTLILDNVRYRMDLKDHRQAIYPYGVQIPHMEFSHINAKMKNVNVVEDDVTCRIVRFATVEKSGFTLKDMHGDVHVSRYGILAKNMGIETGASTIELDAELKYNTWKGIKGYVSTVEHQTTLRAGTRVSMSDVAYWAPVLWGIDAVAEAEGTASGTIDSLTTDMMVRWGANSSALVAGTVVGLPKIDTTVFDLNVEHLSTNVEDLSPLIKKLDSSPSLTKIIEEVGYVNLSATVKGGIKDNAAVNMLIDSRLGQLRTDATLLHKPGSYRFTIDAGSDGLGLGLLRSDWITRSGFDLSLAGFWQGDVNDLKQWSRILDIAIDGHLTNSIVKGHPLSAASIVGELKQGVLTASVESTDSLANLSLIMQSNLGDSLKSYHADLDILNLDLDILPRPLATSMTADLNGNTLDEMEGTVRVRSTSYGNLTLRNIALDIETDQQGKTIELESDLADIDIRGQFNYSDLPLIVRYFGQLYLPEMFQSENMIDSSLASSLVDKTLSCQLRWHDDGTQLHRLAEGIGIARGTRADISYNYGEQMKLVVRSDSLSIGSIKLDNVGITGRPIGERYVLQLESQSLNVGRLELVDRLRTILHSSQEQATAELTWGSMESPSRGDLMLALEGHNIRVIKPDFYVGENPWVLAIEQMVLTNNDRLGIVCDRLSVESQQQKINARLSLQGLEDDCVEMFFNKFRLDLLSDLLLQDSPIDIHGNINGRFSLYGLNSTPFFNTNLSMDSCEINQQYLGELQLSSNWNAELNMLDMQVQSRQLDANGWIEMGKKDPELTLNADFRDFRMAMAEPLLSSFSSHFDGKLNGNLSISGSLKKPLIVGDAMVQDGELKVDITNVTYRFSDSLMFTNNIIRLNDFDIVDPLGNIAYANGRIELADSHRIVLDLNVKTDNLLILDQKSGEQFYGKLFASADGQVTGPVNNLDIAVRARTNPGCELTVPISYKQSVKSQNFITFVGDEMSDEILTESQERKSNFNLELDFSITSDMKLNLPMDFKEVGANVGATGAGDLHLNINGNAAPQVIGNYVISTGQMKVSLFSVYEKRFTIENGSSLNFQGNVPDARFDMRAVYSQRVNLSTLTGNLSSIDNTQKYLQVENVIAIAGTLQDPSISFDLCLPNADQSVEEEVFAYIDRKSERDMLNQTLSLLISGSFYNVNSENSQGGGADALGMVTSFVGNSLTDMVQFVDVNIDYKSGNEFTNQQLDVNISKDWGRWYLESTLGYGGESRELEASSVNGTVIDALIGYRLSPMFHIFAYNRTNTNDYTRMDLPYKQGAGLKLTKDFDRWSDLFKSKKSPKSKNQKEKKK